MRPHAVAPDVPVFGPEVAGVSLGAQWPIVFSRRRHGPREVIPLPALSAYVMRGVARTDWFHQIPPRHQAETRVSLTFRTIAKTRPPAVDRTHPSRRQSAAGKTDRNEPPGPGPGRLSHFQSRNEPEAGSVNRACQATEPTGRNGSSHVRCTGHAGGEADGGESKKTKRRQGAGQHEPEDAGLLGGQAAILNQEDP